VECARPASAPDPAAIEPLHAAPWWESTSSTDDQYFWFKRFAALEQQRDGSNSGLEQQVSQLLERLEHEDFDVDWALLGQLDAEVTNVRG
jgi:hypothetical protein